MIKDKNVLHPSPNMINSINDDLKIPNLKSKVNNFVSNKTNVDNNNEIVISDEYYKIKQIKPDFSIEQAIDPSYDNGAAVIQNTFNNTNDQEIKETKTNRVASSGTARPSSMNKTRPSTACVTLTRKTISRENKRRSSTKSSFVSSRNSNTTRRRPKTGIKRKINKSSSVPLLSECVRQTDKRKFFKLVDGCQDALKSTKTHK